MNNVESALQELMALPIFARMSRTQVADLCGSGRIQVLNHRQALYRMGDSAQTFGVVLSGAFKLTKHSQMGEDVIVHFSTPGDVIAAFIMTQPRPVYPVSAISMGASRFLSIPRETYLNVWKQNPDLIFQVQSLLSTRMHLLQNQKMLARAPLNQRVASLLLDLVDQKSDGGGELELPLPLTRKEIADSLGSSVEAVIRIMSEWSKAGLISTNERHIRVLRSDKLIDLSLGVDPS